MPGDAEREAWLRHRANGFSDEFRDAARAISATKRNGAMQRENAADEKVDGQSLRLQGAAGVDPQIERQREKIAQFVGAMARAGLAAPKDEARARLMVMHGKAQSELLAAKTPAKQMLLATKSRAAALASASAIAGAQQSLSSVAGADSDRDFLSKFATKDTVDHGEDFPCGWPGPACASPGGETGGGIMGGGNPRDGGARPLEHAFFCVRACVGVHALATKLVCAQDMRARMLLHLRAFSFAFTPPSPP